MKWRQVARYFSPQLVMAAKEKSGFTRSPSAHRTLLRYHPRLYFTDLLTSVVLSYVNFSSSLFAIYYLLNQCLQTLGLLVRNQLERKWLQLHHSATLPWHTSCNLSQQQVCESFLCCTALRSIATFISVSLPPPPCSVQLDGSYNIPRYCVRSMKLTFSGNLQRVVTRFYVHFNTSPAFTAGTLTASVARNLPLNPFIR